MSRTVNCIQRGNLRYVCVKDIQLSLYDDLTTLQEIEDKGQTPVTAKEYVKVLIDRLNELLQAQTG